ncbi:hypothetical protein N9V49_03765 [Flavobacteriaceae bacterium]|nr:hypothetical protein [Flavobacteriaceae bacterium]MDC6462051.1 hypothetical protein [Flavobacteriaceae bacterium]
MIFLIISSTGLTGQEGSKIDLNNVNVGTQRLPTIFLFGEEYTSRDRNELIRGILRSQFYRESLKIVINLEEFTSKREFSFRHSGPIEINLDGKKLKNQNYYNSFTSNKQTYQIKDDSKLVRLLLRVKNVRIDSSLTGIIKRKAIGKQIKLTKESIEKLVNEMKLEVRGDTIVLPEIDKANKKKERELNKLFRVKKRLDKEFSENPLIEIKISTN